MSDTKITIAIVEPSYMVRKGLIHALSKSPIIAKVVELKETEDIKYQIEIIQPDALIINAMLMGYISRQNIKQQLGLGKNTMVIALFYNIIDEQFSSLYDAVLRINDPESKIIETVESSFNPPEDKTTSQEELSDREKEILISIVKGMSNKEIADYHYISIHTAITHRRNIIRKLKIHSISGLTIYAIINKLIDMSDIDYKNQ